ncbi:unnamed protein product [Ophioblennius macclurei]
MDDPDDKCSSEGFEPLFIREEEGDQDRMQDREGKTNLPGLSFTGTQLQQSALLRPYLQEMDELLKSCEELTGIPFGSQYSENHIETSLSQSGRGQGKGDVTMESYGETHISPPAYLSTNYLDTNRERARREDQLTRGQSHSTVSRCRVTRGSARQTEMPLTTAGNKLSESMVEYEGQLMGMLAMLENCMEESGMDFEPQDWVTDLTQEYVHINQSPHPYRGTTLTPPQRERPTETDTQPMQLDSGQQVEEDEVSKDLEDRGTNGSQLNPQPSCDSMEGQITDHLDTAGFDPKLGFMGLEETNATQMFKKGADTKRDITETERDDTELPDEKRHKLKMDTDAASGLDELEAVGSQMEGCIEEVQLLEKRRKELLAEVLQLRGQKDPEEPEAAEKQEETEEQIDSKVAELMNVLKMEKEGRREERKKEMAILKEEKAEEERRTWKVNLERQGLHDELRKLKRRLFAIARDCAQNQAVLNKHRREVELLKREEEQLKSVVLQLTEEGCQLKSAQKQQLSDLQAKLQAQRSNQTSNTQDELTECRRHSCGDLEQYVQGGLKSLEDRYEPILVALLKRREAAEASLVKAKEQAQELRAQLTPLREEIQKLLLQRACLEEKLKLINMQRREDMGQYKETVYYLEESSRELRTELQIQKKKTTEMAELKDSLSKQLLLYRAVIKDHNKPDHEEKT